MAESNKCPQCGAPIAANATECPYCGEAIAQTQPQMQQPQMQQPQMQQPQMQQPQMQQPFYQTGINDGINPAWPIKNKIVAAILAIVFGSFGIHKFYLGKNGSGILYLLFCWTGIPSIIGFIEGILYLVSNDHNFQVNHHVRLQ